MMIFNSEQIKRNIKDVLSELPQGVILEVAAKHRTAEEILEAINAGVTIIGENYVQEAVAVHSVIGHKAKWHFIGHLQKNKVRKAVQIFDMLETIDSSEIAQVVNRIAGETGKMMPVLVEINSGYEEQKTGVAPEHAEELIKVISRLENIQVMGLMTMGPRFGDPEKARPYFRVTRQLFNCLKQSHIEDVEMKFLSMGMSGTYRVAIEEGTNIVRIGTKIFGPRNK
jgi:hypothetical protein